MPLTSSCWLIDTSIVILTVQRWPAVSADDAERSEHSEHHEDRSNDGRNDPLGCSCRLQCLPGWHTTAVLQYVVCTVYYPHATQGTLVIIIINSISPLKSRFFNYLILCDHALWSTSLDQLLSSVQSLHGQPLLHSCIVAEIVKTVERLRRQACDIQAKTTFIYYLPLLF